MTCPPHPANDGREGNHCHDASGHAKDGQTGPKWLAVKIAPGHSNDSQGSRRGHVCVIANGAVRIERELIRTQMAFSLFAIHYRIRIIGRVTNFRVSCALVLALLVGCAGPGPTMFAVTPSERRASTNGGADQLYDTN